MLEPVIINTIIIERIKIIVTIGINLFRIYILIFLLLPKSIRKLIKSIFNSKETKIRVIIIRIGVVIIKVTLYTCLFRSPDF